MSVTLQVVLGIICGICCGYVIYAFLPSDEDLI